MCRHTKLSILDRGSRRDNEKLDVKDLQKQRNMKRRQKEERERKTHLLLVPHGAFASHHDLAACFSLQLFGSEPTRPEDSPHKVELHTHR